MHSHGCLHCLLGAVSSALRGAQLFKMAIDQYEIVKKRGAFVEVYRREETFHMDEFDSAQYVPVVVCCWLLAAGCCCCR